jgi:hypothetical protein
MEIKSFTVADLRNALLSDDFWAGRTLPITKHRALSYCHNPRVDEDDLVLLVAYKENRVMGYLGILPDKIFTNNATYKFGWLTSWWVDPEFKTTGVGAILLFRALGAYHQYLGVSGGSKEARKVLQASKKFMVIKTLRGLNARYRLNATRAIPRLFPQAKIFRVMFKIFDDLAAEGSHIRSFFWKRRHSIFQRMTFEYLSCIDEETGRFIQGHHQQDLTCRGKSDLNWMMRYPWIVSAPLKDLTSRRYYFSSRSDRFSYLGVKVFEQDKGMIGFFLLKVRDDRMSVEYCFFDNRDAKSVTAAVIYQAVAMRVSALILYDHRLVECYSELRAPHWSTKSVSRDFYLSKALADLPLAGYRLHAGDGDLAFY